MCDTRLTTKFLVAANAFFFFNFECYFPVGIAPSTQSALFVEGVRAQCSSSGSRTLTATVWSSLPTWSQPSLPWRTWPSSWRSRTRTTQWERSTTRHTLSGSLLLILSEHRALQTCPNDVHVSLHTDTADSVLVVSVFVCVFACVCAPSRWQETGSSSLWWWIVSSSGCLSSSPPWAPWPCS